MSRLCSICERMRGFMPRPIADGLRRLEVNRAERKAEHRREKAARRAQKEAARGNR